MTGVSLVAANLTTICLESFFYGIFFVLALASIYILAHRNSHSDPLAPPQLWIQALRSITTSPMLLAAAGLFIGNTAVSKPVTLFASEHCRLNLWSIALGARCYASVRSIPLLRGRHQAYTILWRFVSEDVHRATKRAGILYHPR